MKIKADRMCELEKFGYRYTGNYNRGDCWTKEIADCVGDGIIVQGEWAGYNVSYLHPYKDVGYPPIENYTQDLIAAGMMEDGQRPKE